MSLLDVDSFMPTFASESMPLDVYVICVGSHAACGFVQLSQCIYMPACTDCLGGIFAFISMYLKPHLCFRGRFDYLA